MQKAGTQGQKEYLDATLLADFQRCPKLYYYRHEEGYRTKAEGVDVLFGHLLGGALETFERKLAAGCSFTDAHQTALLGLLEGSRNEDGSNKFGQFVTTWRCKGTAKYLNEKGNAAKCPYSHKGKYFVPPAPDVCSCGSETETIELWEPTKASKDINQLVELLVGYTDQAPSRTLKTISKDDKPLVEHFFELEFYHPFMFRPVMLCGNLDAVKSFGDEDFIVDYKTTGKSLDANYWKGFSPNVQVDLYNMCASRALPDLNIKGVAIEAFTTAGGTGTSFRLFRATDGQKAEMFEDTAYFAAALQASQQSNFWPRNRTSCFLCSFQPVCSREPEVRQSILDANFTRAKWNPKTRTSEPITGTAIPSTSGPAMPSKPTENSSEPLTATESTPTSGTTETS